MLIRTLAQATVLFSLAGTALAGPADSASAHFKAIADGNVDEIMQGYADGAVLQWMGGPLNGAYAGADRLREVWTRFTQAQGRLAVTVTRLEESANDKGATVTANVEFKGKAPIKVRYVLAYREGKVVSEIWQIDPKLAMGY